MWDLEERVVAAAFHGEDAGSRMLLANDQAIVAGSLDGSVRFLQFNR